MSLLLQTVFETVSCARCHIVFAIAADYERDLRHTHESFYCPRGHSLVFKGKSEAEKAQEEAEVLRRRVRLAEASRQAAWDQAAAAERSARAYRGHLTRMRNKIANGVCPVNRCRRHFDSVQDHIRTVHPEWAAEHVEALA